MFEEILKYLVVYATSGIKFIFGPSLGAAYGFSVFVTGSLTVLGVMTSVYLFTFFGTQIKYYWEKISKKKKRKVLFTKGNRRFVVFWKKYGVIGIAFLTPVLLTPIGGTIIANALGCRKKDIFLYMWISSIFWSYPIAWAVKFASDLLFFW